MVNPEYKMGHLSLITLNVCNEKNYFTSDFKQSISCGHNFSPYENI